MWIYYIFSNQNHKYYLILHPDYQKVKKGAQNLSFWTS